VAWGSSPAHAFHRYETLAYILKSNVHRENTLIALASLVPALKLFRCEAKEVKYSHEILVALGTIRHSAR